MTTSHTKGLVRAITLVAYCFVFVPVLIAFSGWTTVSDTSTAAQRLIIFHGDGFKIGYPRGWKAKNDGSGIEEFTSPGTTALFLVGSIPNPNALLSANDALTIFERLLIGMHGNGFCQMTGSGHSSVAGARWNKAILTCHGTRISVATLVALAINHPGDSPNTRLFLIVYLAPPNQFGQDKNLFFQPMLRSFAFR